MDDETRDRNGPIEQAPFLPKVDNSLPAESSETARIELGDRRCSQSSQAREVTCEQGSETPRGNSAHLNETIPSAVNAPSDQETLPSGPTILDTCCPPAVFLLRAAHGFAYNIVFANQIHLLQVYVGVGQNGAQRLAKFLSAVCSVTPTLVAKAMGHMLIPLKKQSLIGCAFKLISLLMLSSTALHYADPILHWTVLCGLFVFYPLGLGAILSSLPAVAVLDVPSGERTQFMHRFYMFLAVGAIVGIIVSGVSRSVDCYAQGFILAFVVFLMGTLAFASPKGADSAPAKDAKNVGSENHPRFWPLLLLIPFYAAYLQWTTSWFILASYADCNIFGLPFPACFLQAAERVSAMCVLMFGQSDSGKHLLSGMHFRMKFSVGCCIASVALILSACAERLRRDAPRLDAHSDVSSLSVLWLLPQYCCIAVAEALVFPTQTEWASGSPVLLGMGVAVQACAAVALGVILPYIEFWVPQGSPNDGHYEYYFLMIAVGCVLSAALFACIPASLWSSCLEEGDVP